MTERRLKQEFERAFPPRKPGEPVPSYTESG
jgi:hypothetical protein